MTSSTLSGVAFNMPSKYLDNWVSAGDQYVGTLTDPSMYRSSTLRTFSHTGHIHVVVCSIRENHDKASKHWG